MNLIVLLFLVPFFIFFIAMFVYVTILVVRIGPYEKWISDHEQEQFLKQLLKDKNG